MYIINITSGCTHEEASFVSLDDLGSISILLDENNDLEERVTYLFNEVSIFIFKFENQSGSEYTQNMYRNTSKFEGSRQTLKKLSIYFNDFSANIYLFKVVIKTWV